ncbi:MAG: preprotein translocase subunit SecG [Beijerinckiaceae bacterium]
MQTVIIVIHLMIVLALVALILLQRSEGGGLGMGGGGVQGFMTGRGQANALTRATAILATGFFLTSLILSIMAGQGRAPRSIIDGAAPVSAPAPGQPAPPIGSGQGGVLDQLRQMQQPSGAPAAPTPPAPAGAPQVPQSR